MKKILLVVVAGVFLLVGASDFDDELLLEKEYCEMVNDGVWQNYKNLECNNA